jgi:uncharacterized protein YutE (UPF0331/DUF86 family)
MSGLDEVLLAEKAAAIERHLARVEARRPARAEDLRAHSDISDSVILHLWQAVQLAIDLGVSAHVRAGLGSPATYGDALRGLARARILPQALADALVRATGFRNAIVHAYEDLDLQRVFAAAQAGPADLRAFLAHLRDHARRG